MIMKHFTQMKKLLAVALACFGSQIVLHAQEQDSIPEEVVTTTTYNVVNHITSGKTYIIGILVDNGWLAAEPPFVWMYPGGGRVSCIKSFEPNDDMQVVLGQNDYLPTFVFTTDEAGTLIQSADGAYLSLNMPFDDGKDEGKDDGKDDGKGNSNELSFWMDQVQSTDYYWDVTYSDDLGGFVLKHKTSNATVGVDYTDLSSVVNGEVVVNYEWRLAPYVTLPDDLVQPIYLFERQDSESTGVSEVGVADTNMPVTVYNISGMKVGSSLNGLPSGLYLVKQGKSVKKVLIK